MNNRESLVRRDFWTKIKRVARQVPFAQDAVAAYYCAFDPKTPARVKGVLLAALAYFILPLDVVPDFVLGLGFTDDMAVLLAAVNVVRVHLHQRHRDKARDTLDRMRQGDPAAV